MQHRLNTADHLRGISERNGNERLLDTADRQEQKAREQYERRLKRIEARENPVDDPVGDPAEHSEGDLDSGPDLKAAHQPEPKLQHRETQAGAPNAAPKSPRALTGRSGALERQRLNEERKLQHRLNTAAKLREIGQRNGNDQLLETADRMEKSALEHYESRLQRIEEQEGRLPQPSEVVEVVE